MMMKVRVTAYWAAAAVLTAPVPAIAEEPQAVQAVAKDAKSNPPEDKVICRSRREAQTGTNLRMGRECRTASEWKEREVAAKRELQRLRDKAQTPGMGEGR